MPKTYSKTMTSGKQLDKSRLAKLTSSFKSHSQRRANKKLLIKGVKKAKKPPAGPEPFSVAVLDIGQGGCNIVASPNIACYFDVGRPVNWHHTSEPPNLVPCTDQGISLVVLSHWDRDHWLLGSNAALMGRAWVVPEQPVGPATYAFFTALPNKQTFNFPVGHAGVLAAGIPELMLHRSLTAAGPFEDINDTGLAMSVRIDTPNGPHYVVLCGDAGFSEFGLDPVVWNNIRGICAPHHGGLTNDVAGNVPAPVAAPGCIAYSFGVRPWGNPAGVHCYGHPLPPSVALYANAGWTNRRETARGLGVGGNILMGRFTPQQLQAGVVMGCNCNPPCSFRNFPAQQLIQT